MTTDEAVEYGIKSTASVVTSAAAVVVAVFAIFGSLDIHNSRVARARSNHQRARFGGPFALGYG